MDRFLNIIRREAATLDSFGSQPRFAIVKSVDPKLHAAKVEFQPEGVMSGWLPIGTGAVGSNIGIASPYRPGDQVIVLPTQNSIENGVIIAGIYSDEQLAPKTPEQLDGDPSNVEAGGWALVHPSGSAIRINHDGSMILTAPHDFQFVGNIKVKGDVDVDGKIHATKNIESDQDVKDKTNTLDALRQHYNQHHHTGVQSGGGITGPTDQMDN